MSESRLIPPLAPGSAWNRDISACQEQIRSERTVVDNDWYRALLGHLSEEGFESLLIPRKGSGIVPAGDDDGIVSTSSGSFVRELDSLAGASCASSGDNRYVRELSCVKRTSSGLDEGYALGMRQVVRFAHGAGQERADTRFREPDDMGLKRRDVYRPKSAQAGRSVSNVAHRGPPTREGRRSG
jgi:hypothetical protein